MAPIRLTDQSPRSAEKEPIAICGLACRLPGDSTSASKLWDLVANARTGNCPVPASRFNIDGFYHPKGNDRAGSVITKGGYFLNEDTREFENTFFGINNLEATYMDPQQRKLLEVVYECLENAGIPLDAASGSNTGVYVGNFTFDYLIMQSRDADYLTRYNSTGMGTSILGNRISHVYNLKGPSLVVDTACSSSLYCLHVACVALENYECDAAIVAGANLIQSAEQHIGTMKAGVLSPTSECHTFDASADGYGRAEGIGALYVKRLSDALRDGDPIRSVVRASAINANGKTAGIALPSADGQEAVVRKAMAKANLSPDDIAYLECHGTGTKVGDAIEVEGATRVFNRGPDNRLVIGSVKSNVGHSEAASGIAGVIKATMAIEHGQIPPTYGLKNLNPKLAPFEHGVSIPTELVPWPGKAGDVRRAGINSFGYGGANAHVIIEQSPRLGVERELANPQAAVVLPLSAATTAALEGRKSDLAEYDFGSTNILDLAYTLGSRRTNFQNRGYVLASTATGLGETFKTKNLVTGSASSTVAEQPLAFIFTGQGSQWAGMCKELFQFPVFSEAFEEMDKALQSIAEAPSWTLKEAVLDTSNPDLINTPQRSQPCCTAVQVALIQLLASWGIVPSKTIGHSSGEIAAAFAAGHLSAAESIVIAYYRGYCVSKRTSDGAMMAAGLSEADAVSKIAEAGLDGQIRVACVNSPEGVTISGDNSAIDSIVSILSGNGTFARKLKTGGQAYHSQHMLPIGQEYQDFLEKTIPTLGASTTLAKRAVVVSSVTADLKSSGFGPSYWRSNLEGQVKFAQAIKRLHADGLHTFVELGPHTSMELPVKQSLAKEGVAGSEVLYLGPIKRSTDAIETSLTVPAKLWLAGYEVDWNLVNGLSEAPAGTFEVVTELPRYRFQYTELLWSEGRPSIEYRQRKHTRHELLGTLIPGGNGDDLIFRNIVQLSDIKWLEDHRLEETPVFPGTGYLGTAMEAVMRAADIPISEKPTFTFSNVHVLNALTIPTEAAAKIELFTSLHKSNITNSATSSKWWDFIISTFQEGSSVQHAKGSVSVTTEDVPLQSKYQSSTAALEPTAKRTWYNQLIKGGLNYGPLFQPITEFSTPSMTSSPFTSAKLPLITACGDDLAVYPVHPITLDAMLQAAIVSTAKGLPSELKAKVPTRFGTLTIKTGTDGPATIYAASQSVGFGAVETHSEIVDASGQVVVQFDNVRMTPYSSGAPVDSDGERHPMLRNLWKPDLYGLGFISVSDFQKHMDQFVAEADSPLDDDSLIRLGAALDLAVHKNARVRVLELGNDVHDISLAVLDLLASKSDFKRAANYTTASFTESGALSGGLVDLETGERSDAEELSGEKYDIVLIPVAGAWIEQNAGKIEELLEDDATILALAPTSAASAFKTSALTAQAYPIHSGENSVVVARKNIPTEQSTKLEKYLIVERNGQSALGFGLENALSGKLVHRVQLQDLTEELVSNKPIIFNLVEAKDPLLSVINDEEMPKVKLMTDNAGTIVWVTNGNLTQGERPDFALISGLARALSLEQPALKLYVYDIDTAEPSVPETTEKLMTVLNQFSRYPDIEFAQRGNLVHVSRFVPDDGLNTAFRSKQGLHLDSLALKDAGEVRLDIAQAGQYDSIFFKAQESTESIPSTHIRIKVASAGINAKDYYLLGGKVDVENATPSLEYAGTVEEVGQDVTNFTAGDKVVVMAPSHFQNYQTIPEWAAVKLEDGEDMNVAATLPVVWATAIYALHNRASIQEGESVLIHSGAGGVGIAAIQIAQQAGAEVFTTVSTEEKKQYLVNTFGLNPENVFSSRGDSFLAGILEKTGGRGVDVVLNSLTGDQLHATWRAIADSGRFVEIGKMDLTNAGRLEMDQFLKNTTFTAFDLTHLYTSTNPKQNAIWHQLLEQTVQLWRSGKLAGLEDTLQVFDIADTVAAYRRFSSRNRMGKVAINFQNGDSKISVRPLKHKTRFSADKSYVMIGCLGGLGRTLTRWMLQRGAKKFAFMGRSGTDKPAARALVEDVELAGGEAIVVRGDITNEDDVKAVVAAATGEIGGVVQAAMGLNEALFTVMPNEWWHTGIDPKVHGTWYLHNALRASGRDTNLDFFLMTSSISGSVGTATECNYCSGNYFLDIFARYRRALGLPATSVGLGMISGAGYLHDNPEIEALLVRKGIQAIDQDELLQILDISLSANDLSGIHHPYDSFAASHVLTGLEPMGLKELRKKGFEGTNPTLDDPRASLLASALDGQDDVLRHSSTDGLPPALAEALEGGADLKTALLDFVRRRFGNLTLIKFDDVDVKTPFVKFGMDSMLAAEFRTWFYQTLTVDVPFLMFMDKNTTLEKMRDYVLGEMEGSKASVSADAPGAAAVTVTP